METEEEEDIRDFVSLALLRIARDRASEGARPRSIFTLFIFLFLFESAVVDVGLGVVVVFIVGSTTRSLICLVCRLFGLSLISPPQFLTQFSPVTKLLPLPPQPLNLNFLHSLSVLSK